VSSTGVLGFTQIGLGAGFQPGSNRPGYADGEIHLLNCFSLPGEFAATAATSVSGAVAERIRLPSFMLCSVFFMGLVYPILGSWKWGGGGLDQAGFYDFAGSTLGHCVGGWGALDDAKEALGQIGILALR
jgi:Amt family ammonium transporter